MSSLGGWGDSYTSSLYGNPLATHLPGTAVYDPTQIGDSYSPDPSSLNSASTSNSTSAARALGSTTDSTGYGNIGYGTGSSSSSGSSLNSIPSTSSAALGNIGGSSLAQMLTGTGLQSTAAPQTTAAPTANTVASIPNYSYNSKLAATVPYYNPGPSYNPNDPMETNTPPSYTNATGHGASSTNLFPGATPSGPAVTYGGPQVVAADVSGGYVYYTFDPATDSYRYSGTNNGQPGTAVTTTGDAVIGGGSTIDPLTGLTQQQEQTASLIGSKGFSTGQYGVVQNNASNQAYVNNTQAGSIAAYNTALQKYNDDMAASRTTNINNQEQADLVNYMINNNGILPSNDAPYGAANIAAAQATYSANDSTQFSPTMATPDTSAVDATNAAAASSLNSQYASNVGGVDSAAMSRAGSSNAATLSGQNVLSHDTAYASSFDTNLTNFANALTTQSTADANATGQKLNMDIQAVSDKVNSLQQQLSQLDTATQMRVGSQLTNMQQLINEYQQASNNFKQNSGFVSQIAQAILSSGAGLFSAITKAA